MAQKNNNYVRRLIENKQFTFFAFSKNSPTKTLKDNKTFLQIVSFFKKKTFVTGQLVVITNY